MGGRTEAYTRGVRLSTVMTSVLPRTPEEADYSIATNRGIRAGFRSIALPTKRGWNPT